jgi:hypothetical protein
LIGIGLFVAHTIHHFVASHLCGGGGTRHSDSFFNDKIRLLLLYEKGVAGLDSSQSQSSPKRRGRSTPTAKRTPNIRYLALGFTAVITSPQRQSRSPSMLVMLSAVVGRLQSEASLPQRRRCLCPSPASPRSGCAQMQRHSSSSWGSIFVLLTTTFEFAVSNNETLHRGPSILAMLPAACWRLLSQASLPQQRRCLCPSPGSPRSGCAQVQRYFSSSWGKTFVLWATTIEFFAINNETL